MVVYRDGKEQIGCSVAQIYNSKRDRPPLLLSFIPFYLSLFVKEYGVPLLACIRTKLAFYLILAA